MYFLSSFFNQFGPNAVTFLVAAEVYPPPQSEPPLTVSPPLLASSVLSLHRSSTTTSPSRKSSTSYRGSVSLACSDRRLAPRHHGSRPQGARAQMALHPRGSRPRIPRRRRPPAPPVPVGALERRRQGVRPRAGLPEQDQRHARPTGRRSSKSEPPTRPGSPTRTTSTRRTCTTTSSSPTRHARHGADDGEEGVRERGLGETSTTKKTVV